MEKSYSTDELMKVRSFAKSKNISQSTVRNMMKNNKVNWTELDGTQYIIKDELSAAVRVMPLSREQKEQRERMKRRRKILSTNRASGRSV